MHEAASVGEEGSGRRRRRSASGAAALALVAIVPWCWPALLWWPERAYWADLLSHFGPHAGCALALAGCAVVALRARWAGASFIAAGLACLVTTWAGSNPPAAPAHGARTVSIVVYNAKSDRGESFLAWLRNEDPDLVCIVEAPPGVEFTPWVQERYPFRVSPRPGLMWAMVILSKFPTDPARVIDPKDEMENWSSFVARRSVVVRADDRTKFLFGGTHPPSPRRRQTWLDSLRQVEGDGRLLRAWRERTGLPAVVVGDFNSSALGRVHRAFARASGFRAWNAPYGAGTWPGAIPAWLALPIDKAWTAGDVEVVSMRVGPRFGSDHRPVALTVALGGAR